MNGDLDQSQITPPTIPPPPTPTAPSEALEARQTAGALRSAAEKTAGEVLHPDDLSQDPYYHQYLEMRKAHAEEPLPELPAPPNIDQTMRNYNSSVMKGSSPLWSALAFPLMFLGLGSPRTAFPASYSGLSSMQGYAQSVMSMTPKQSARYRAAMKESIAMIQQVYHNRRQYYEDIMKNWDLTFEQKKEALATEAALHGDMKAAQAIEAGNFGELDKQQAQKMAQLKALQTASKQFDDFADNFTTSEDDMAEKASKQADAEEKEARTNLKDTENAQKKIQASPGVTDAMLKGAADQVEKANKWLGDAKQRAAAAREAYNQALLKMGRMPRRQKASTEAKREQKAAEAGEPQQEAPEVGTVIRGYRFNGGDPSDENNWEPE